jgi:hypothetical protein
MMWATSACPQNGRLPAMGGGREAMAKDTHGVDVRKSEAPVCQKKVKKNRSDVGFWQESAYDRNGIDLGTGLNVPRLRYPCFG